MKQPKQQRLLLLSICSCSIFVALAALLGTAKAAQPVVVGSIITNQFQVTITNGTNGAVYEILWTPLLSNPLYPWAHIATGAQNQTNFLFSMGTSQVGFFEARVGNDQDGDGVFDQYDARPYDPTIGILTVTIESPANGSTVQ